MDIDVSVGFPFDWTSKSGRLSHSVGGESQSKVREGGGARTFVCKSAPNFLPFPATFLAPPRRALVIEMTAGKGRNREDRWIFRP